MKHLCVGMATLVLCLYASSADAAVVLGSQLTFDGNADSLFAESRSKLVDNGDAVLGLGDELFGFARVATINGMGVNGQIAFVFSATIAGGAGTLASPFTYSPTTGGNSLSNLLPADIVATVPTGVFSNVFALALTHSLNSPSGPPNPLHFTGATATAQMQQFTAASGYMYELAVGFEAGDFFESNITTPSPEGGTEAGGFTVLHHVYGPDVQFLTSKVLHLPGSPTGTSSSHEFSIDAPTSFSSAGAPSPWTYTDSTFMRINGTPEPASLLAWAGLAGGFGLLRLRRRKSKPA